MTARVGELIHADWSVDPRKRWAAFARREGSGFAVTDLAPFALEPSEIIARGEPHGLLIGFDFPIGVPTSYGRALGLSRFTDLLDRLDEPDFSDFCRPAESASAISAHRPFYPARPFGARRDDLARGHGVGAFTDLSRRCDRATEHRPAGATLFWTLGANQVGRGAALGWRDVVAPLRKRAAAVWPFDGELASAGPAPVTIVEAYPAEAMRFLHVHPGRGFSKRRQDDRRAVATRIHDAAARTGVRFAPDVAHAVDDGFGSDAYGEDRFDTLLGLLGMAAVVCGLRAEGLPDAPEVRTMEGWILGQDGAAVGALRAAA